VVWTATSPSSLVLWLGAGISVDSPTNGPRGTDLTHRALDGFMMPSTAATIRDLYDTLQVPNADMRPRLETVLDAVFEVYGARGLRSALNDLEGPPSNAHHEFLNTLGRAGASLITANFDTCIERSSGSPAEVVHFHGELAPHGDIAGLGARLGVIENGFPAPLVARLDHELSRADVEWLVVIGYSGSDFFDATPYLVERLSGPGAPRVLWYEYSTEAFDWDADADIPGRDLLARLRGSGVQVTAVKGPLRDLFARMSGLWGLPLPHPGTALARRDWTGDFEPSEPERRAASAALFARMGYRAGVIDAYSEQRALSPVEWDRLADAYWGAGRYRKARAAWEAAFSGGTLEDRARRAERRGAIKWVRGDLLAAERTLWRAIRRWASPETAVSDRAKAALLETYGRVVQHMERMPDARWFVRRGRARQVGARLAEVRASMSGSEGVALRARLANVARALEHAPDEGLAQHRDAFSESEALSSWLNYEHSWLRERATSPAHAGSRPDRADYAVQASRERAIGATGDLARVYMIPGATAHYRVGEFWRALKPVEFTGWHKARMIVGYAIQRYRHLLKRG